MFKWKVSHRMEKRSSFLYDFSEDDCDNHDSSQPGTFAQSLFKIMPPTCQRTEGTSGQQKVETSCYHVYKV